MPSIVVVGTQWGDEGKGKIVHLLGKEADMIVRYQGGPNAGHTVVFDDKLFVLHLIPAGILIPKKICIISHGVGGGALFLPEEKKKLFKKLKLKEGCLFLNWRTLFYLITKFWMSLKKNQKKGKLKLEPRVKALALPTQIK